MWEFTGDEPAEDKLKKHGGDNRQRRLPVAFEKSETDLTGQQDESDQHGREKAIFKAEKPLQSIDKRPIWSNRGLRRVRHSRRRTDLRCHSIPFKQILSSDELCLILAQLASLFYLTASESQPYRPVPFCPGRNVVVADSVRQTRSRRRPPGPGSAHSRKLSPARRLRCDCSSSPRVRMLSTFDQD